MIGTRILQLSRDSLIYGLGSALSSFISIALVPVLTRIFAPSEYGVLDLLVTVSFLAIAFLAFGFDASMAILFFDTDNEEARVTTISTAVWFVFFTASAVVLVLLPFSKIFSRLLFESEAYIRPLQFTLITIPFSLLLGLSLNGLRLRFARGRYLLAVIFQVILTITVTSVMLIMLHAGITGYFLAALISVAATGFLTVRLSSRNIAFRFSTDTLRKLLGIGLPLVPAGLAGWSLSLINRFFISHYSLHELGLFALGVKISSILGLGISALQLAWGPFALSLAKLPDAKPTYAKILTVYTYTAGLIAIVLTAFAQEIIGIISGSSFSSSAQVVGWLSLGLVAYGSYYIVAIGVSISKKTSHIAWTTTVAACLNILLSFILIPRFGMLGAAISTLISYALSAWLVYRVAQRYYPIPFEIRKVACVWFVLIIFTIGYSFLPQEINPELFLWKITSIVVFPILLYALRVIQKGELVYVKNLLVSLAQRISH